MNKLPAIKRKLRPDSLLTRILCCLLLMFVLLSLWVTHLYQKSASNLFHEEQAKSDMLMTACATALTDLIEGRDYEKARCFADRLLLLKNTQTDQPFLDGLTIKTLEGEEIVHEGPSHSRDGFVSETLLYSNNYDRSILGSLKIRYNKAYYQQMSRSILMDLVTALTIVFGIICIAMILLNYFLRPLWHLAGELEEFPTKRIERLSPLKGSVSREIRRVKQAIDLLLESHANHRIELENKVKERTADLKSTLTALGESEAKYRNLVEQSRDGIIIVQDRAIIFANLRFAEIVGCARDTLTGRFLGDFLLNEQEKYPSAVNNEGGLPLVSENILQRANGEPLHVELNAGSIQYNYRTAELIIVRDVSDRKRMEIELIKNRNLDSLGVLAGGIAHDFNNLLTALFGNIELAQMHGVGSETASRLLSEAIMAAERAKSLTRQLLTFSKGGSPIKGVASVSDIVRETCSLVLSGSAIKVFERIPGDIWPIEVDRNQICQVLHNLLLNAKNAMPGGGHITIRAENYLTEADEILPLPGGRYIRLIVKDSGTGIRQEDLSRIFDPYFTTQNGGEGRGTGLGLAICHSIVKRYGGYIHVKSEFGKGAEFHVYLPATDKTPKTAESRRSDRESRNREDNGGKRILFMDDETAVFLVAEQMLGHLGFTATYAENGEKAIVLYQEALHAGRPFEAVILDLTVRGGMGGELACRKLMEIDPSVCAIVATGYAEDPIVAQFREYGFKFAITKPFTLETLKHAIYQAFHFENDKQQEE